MNKIKKQQVDWTKFNKIWIRTELSAEQIECAECQANGNMSPVSKKSHRETGSKMICFLAAFHFTFFEACLFTVGTLEFDYFKIDYF